MRKFFIGMTPYHVNVNGAHIVSLDFSSCHRLQNTFTRFNGTSTLYNVHYHSIGLGLSNVQLLCSTVCLFSSFSGFFFFSIPLRKAENTEYIYICICG